MKFCIPITCLCVYCCCDVSLKPDESRAASEFSFGSGRIAAIFTNLVPAKGLARFQDLGHLLTQFHIEKTSYKLE
jgi:hypothetical protein